MTADFVRQGWWILPNGWVEEVGEHGHDDWLLEHAKLLPDEAERRGYIRLIKDYDWTYSQKEPVKPGHPFGWGVELDMSDMGAVHPLWRQHLQNALDVLGARRGEQVHIYDTSTNRHRQFSWDPKHFAANPPLPPHWIPERPTRRGISYYGSCQICGAEGRELDTFKDQESGMQACESCAHKWEAHKLRSREGNALWEAYVAFQKTTGRDVYFQSMEVRDRRQAEWLEKFRAGQNYFLKKPFEAWLREHPVS